MTNPTEAMREEAELKPCPMDCGLAFWSTTFDGDHYVSCANDQCRCMVGYFQSRAEAIAAWNTRALPLPPVVEEVEAYLMDGPWELDPNGTSPGIYMNDPAGGDPLCIATFKRIHRPNDLRAALQRTGGE